MNHADQADRRGRFESVVDHVIEPVRQYLRRRTDPSTAEDVLSETLLVLWRRLDDVPAEGHVGWTIAVARLQLSNATRSQRRAWRLFHRIAALDPPDQMTAGPPEADENPLREPVDAVLASMRPGDAEVLRLWAWERLEAREIAQVLEITPNAAAVRLHRARARFEHAWRKTTASGGHEQVRGDLDR